MSSLKKCLSLRTAHRLLSQPPLCLRPLASPVLVSCQRNSGSVCPLWLSQSSGESVGLANTNSCWDLHRGAAQLPASAHSAHLCHTPCHSCAAPLHSALHPYTCGWRRVTGTLFSTGQCFSHSYQSLPVFLLIWHCKCILIMAPIQISFLLHIDEFHLLGSSTNPGRETTDVQWAQGPGSWVLDSLHCINTTLAFPPFMNVYMLCRSQISPPVHVFNHQVKLSAVQL